MSTSLLSAPTIAAPPKPPIPALERPLAPDALVAALRGFHGSYYVEHPFHQLMHDGKLVAAADAGVGRESARVPARDSAQGRRDHLELSRARGASQVDSAHRRSRRAQTEGEGGIEKWIQLGVAFGVPREEMEDERHVLPGVRFAAEMYVTFCKTKPWVEAAASSLTELFAPDIMRRRLESLPKHYPWIRADAYDYFNSRLTQAPRDSNHGLEIVTTYCTTVETQQRAFEALAFKIEMLWVMIDTIHNAYREE